MVKYIEFEDVFDKTHNIGMGGGADDKFRDKEKETRLTQPGFLSR